MNAVPTRRLFLALWPDEATRAALARCRDAWAWGPAAAPEASARLHLTLHFLGAVPEVGVPVLIDGLHVACPPFALGLDRSECWPNGAAVLTASLVPPALRALHAALRDRLEALGRPTETRAFRPHVTLARRALGAVPPAITRPVPWPVRGYALVASRPAPGEHVVLRHYG